MTFHGSGHSAGQPSQSAPGVATITSSRLAAVLRTLGLLCAGAAAALWAIGLTVLQPLTEPAGSAENNTYWVREIRFMAIAAVACGLILVFRGELTRSVVTVIGSLGWIGVDLWLDRLDVAGRTVTIRTAVVAVVAVFAAGFAGRWRRSEPNRSVLTLAAAVAASLSTAAAATTSPTDTEPSLNPSALVLGSVLAALAIGCALGAVEPLSRGRTLLATVLAFAAVDAVVATRMLWGSGDQPYSALLAASAFLFIAVTVLTRAALPTTIPRWAVTLAIGAGLVVVYWIASLTLGLLGIVAQSGTPFTVLAGSPPVNSADEDVLSMLPAAGAGLAVGGLLIAFSVAQTSPKHVFTPILGQRLTVTPTP